MLTINNLRCAVLNAPAPVSEDMICAGPKRVIQAGKDACQVSGWNGCELGG